MATKTANAKQNGTDIKKNGATPKTTTTATQKVAPTQTTPKGANDKEVIQPEDVTKKLAQEALGKIAISIEDRMTAFEQLTGLANQRTRLKNKLNELNKFVFNNGANCEFTVKDEEGKMFTTSNNNLITLVTGILKETLEERKTEIENQIVTFNL